MTKNRKTRSTEKLRSRHNSNHVRVIGGQFRGRKLNFPDIDGLRPTGDRMRETLFNWLTGYIEGATVIDLFAGSGALGLEALSRGAKNVQFIELNNAAASAIHTNLALLLNDDGQHKTEKHQSQVHHRSALDYLKTSPKNGCDLLMLDPPFSLQLHNEVLRLVDEYRVMKDSGHIYIEAPKDQPIKLPTDWSIMKQKQTGQVQFLLLSKN